MDPLTFLIAAGLGLGGTVLGVGATKALAKGPNGKPSAAGKAVKAVPEHSPLWFILLALGCVTTQTETGLTDVQLYLVTGLCSLGAVIGFFRRQPERVAKANGGKPE